MPPRKKAATTDDASADPPKATRSSTRTRKATAPPAAPVAAPPKAAPPKAAPAKAPAKRGRAAAASAAKESEDEADQPKKKKAKKGAKAAQASQDDATKDDVDMPADDQDEPADDEPKKMVTVIKRGAAPVDPMSGRVSTHQVYSNAEGVWDAMLNQTDVSGGSNKNKFYVIQLLHPVGNNSSCILFTRWGRVGENGQCQTKGPFSSDMAVNQFKAQFKSKTATAWESRVGMVAKKGKYTWLERDFNDDEDEEEDKAEGASKKKDEPIPDSKLEKEVQELCNLIFSTSLIDAHLSSMNYDAKKLPLGKLSKATILRGFAALKELSEVIEKQGSRAACEDLTSSYYSIIPHDFGRNRPTIIDNTLLLKKELDLVDALGDMEIASKLIQSSIISDDNGNPLNPVDAHFKSLGLSKMEPVSRTSSEFSCLEKYVKDTHGHTHNIQARVQNIYRVERDSETAAWQGAGFDDLGDGERFLLWHGSRTTNFAGILKQGLRIAPPEAPVTGYMFGKGVYFADMMSKSANYCYSYLSNGVGLLLLCEVAVKPFYERHNAEYDADVNCKKAKARATKGLGRTQPLKWKDAGNALDHDGLVGCHMPDAPGEQVNIPGVYLEYNEYIVYDPSQIRLRYLLMVNM